MNFFMNHYALIIQVLTVVVVVGSLFLAFRGFFASSAGVSASGASIGGDEQMARLEYSLKKVLEKASFVSGAGGGDSGPLLMEIETLKKDLQQKQAEIERVKIESEMSAQAGGGVPSGSGLSSEESDKLQGQIAELQAKLAEYEIISEDIADLSFYKEQTAKLQEEVDRLKKEKELAGSTTTVPPSSPAPSVAAVPEVPASEVAPPNPPPSEPAPPPADEGGGIFDDDLMAEFAAAVAEQKTSTGAPAKTAVPEAKVEEVLPVAAEPEVSDEVPTDLDLSRMVEEAQSLEQVEGVEVDPLAQEMDPDKLAAEASTMESADRDDLSLMTDFEKFADEKKG